MFYDIKTQELLAEHKICEDVGKLVKLPKNGERFKTGKYDALLVKVRAGFENAARVHMAA